MDFLTFLIVSEQVPVPSLVGWLSGRIVSSSTLIIVYPDCRCIYILINFFLSYLYPDGRSINPDLSWAVQVLIFYNVPLYIHILYAMYVKTFCSSRQLLRTT